MLCAGGRGEGGGGGQRPPLFREMKSVAILSHASLLSRPDRRKGRPAVSASSKGIPPRASPSARLYPSARRVAPRRVISSRRNSISDSIIRDAAPPAAAVPGIRIIHIYTDNSHIIFARPFRERANNGALSPAVARMRLLIRAGDRPC